MADFPLTENDQIVLQPPATVGGIVDGLSGFASGEYPGPYRLGANLYTVGLDTGNRPSINKSTDDGATWTNYPSPQTAFLGQASVGSPVFDAAASKIWVVYRSNNTGTLQYRACDISGATPTWGSETNSSTTIDGGVIARLQNNGSIFVFYRVTSGGTYAWRRISSAGAWGSATAIVANVRWVAIDEDDTAHIVYPTSTYFAGNIAYNTITSAGVVGTATTIRSNNISGVTFQYGNAIVDAENDLIIWTYARAPVQASPATDGNSYAGFYVGTPISNPTWTFYDLHGNLPDPAAPNDVWSDGFIFLVRDTVITTRYYFFWSAIWLNNDPFNDVSALYGATWDIDTDEVSDPFLVWNCITVHVPGTSQFEASDYRALGLGVLIEDYQYYFNTTASPTTDNFNDGYVNFLFDVTPAGVVCNNPPSGEVNVPYSHTFIGTGTAPLVFSIAAGALPPGLTMSSSGVVTGTPTLQGTYFFTVMVVAANDEVATVNCSIFINFIEEPPEPHPCPTPDIGTLPSFEGTAISIADELYLRNSLFGDFGLVPPELKLKRQVDRFVKSGTNPTFTLSETPNDDYPVAVYFDGVLQFPTEDYTISGLTYTMVGTFSLTNVRAEYQVPANA